MLVMCVQKRVLVPFVVLVKVVPKYQGALFACVDLTLASGGLVLAVCLNHLVISNKSH